MAAADQLEPAALRRALDYPYERPAWSYRYWPGRGHLERVGSLHPEELAGRTAVLAIGSNAAPEQLRRKFAAHEAGARPIVVLAARLSDHEVVHGALVAGYGSVPATLIERPGTTCHVHVTFLDATQLERMHETEGLGATYRLVRVDAGLVEVDLLGRVEAVDAYVATAGPMLVDGSPVALASIAAEGRTLRAWHHPEVLAHLAAGFELDVEELVLRLTTDPEARRAAGEWLARP